MRVVRVDPPGAPRLRGRPGSTTTAGRRRPVHYRRSAATGGTLAVAARAATRTSFRAPQTGRGHAPARARGHRGRVRPGGERDGAARPARAREDGVCDVSFAVDPTARPRHGRPAPARGAHFTRSAYSAVRIVFDVSPLSHARTGVGNYIRGSLPRLAAAAGTRRRGGRVRAHEPARAPRDPARRSTASRSSGGSSSLPVAHRWRTAWSAARPAAGRALARPLRRPPLHRLDVPAAARRPARSTMIHDLVPLRFPEWTTAAHAPMHGAQVPQRGAHLRRRSSRTRASRPTTSRDRLGVPRERLRRRAPRASTRSIGAERRARRPRRGRTCSRSRRSSRARTSARSSRRARLLGDGLALAVVGGEGWGEQPELDRPGVVRLGCVADERARARSTAARRRSSTRRGSRASACRSSRRWRAARRSSRRRTRRWTRRAATRPCAPIPRARRRSRAAIRGALARARRARRAQGLAHAARVHVGATSARSSSRGTRGGCDTRRRST